MESRKLYHCIFRWRIQNCMLHKRINRTTIKSETFKVKESSQLWYLKLTFDNPDDIYFAVRRKHGQGKCYVRFKLSVINYRGETAITEYGGFLFETGANSLNSSIVSTASKYTDSNFGFYDDTIECEMLFCEDEYQLECTDSVVNFAAVGIQRLADDLKHLRRSEMHSDLLLYVNGGTIPVHKAILFARCSAPEKEKSKILNSDILELDVEFGSMKGIISFLYSGNYQKIFVDRPPSVKLYEYAKQFEINDLEQMLRPQKIYAFTEFDARNEEYNWLVRNFMSLGKNTNEYIESPSFKLTYFSNCKCRLRLYPRRIHGNKEYIEIWVNLFDVTKTFCSSVEQLIMELSFVDGSGNLCHTQRRADTFRKFKYFRFDNFIEREWLLAESNLLSRDMLTVHFSVKISSGAYTSKVQNVFSTISQGFDTVSSLTKDLENLYKQGKYSDFTILADDKDFSVHKAILGARSSVFADVFENRDYINNMRIEGIKPEILEIMLQYIYSGNLKNLNTFTIDTVSGLYYAADKYDVPHLKEICSELLISNLSVENACELLVSSELFNIPEFKSSTIDFICSNMDQVIGAEGWQSLRSGEHSHLANEVLKILTSTYRKQSSKVALKRKYPFGIVENSPK